MLSVRLSTILYDRLKVYVAAKRINMQDFIEETLQARLDELDPLHTAHEDAKARIAASSSSPDDRITRLEAQINRLTEMLAGTTKTRRRA